jgi:hypothetical protein
MIAETMQRVSLRERLRPIPLLRRAMRFVRYRLIGHRDEHWCRVVMNESTLDWVRGLDPQRLDVLEISGRRWEQLLPFQSYRSLGLPEFDVCSEVLDDRFDLIAAEQVFEHLRYPYRAGRGVYEMLRRGGYFLITTPFLIKAHNFPIDCSRWTETGLRYFLEECGFSSADVRTGSWGNQACVRSNLKDWAYYNRWLHSLKNEPEFPLSVWALARKSVSEAAPAPPLRP